MRNTSFNILVILFLSGCEPATNNHPSITINYDYNKEFAIDSFKLTIDRRAFSSIIDTIFNQHIEAYSFLLTSKDFIKIYEYPTLYINNVIAYLDDSSHSKEKATIASLTMLHKDFSNSLNFLYACNYLYKRNLLGEDILFLIFFPPVELGNCDIIKYYEDEQIRSVLNDIRNNSRTFSNLKKIIADILSGKSYREQKDFLANQYKITI